MPPTNAPPRLTHSLQFPGSLTGTPTHRCQMTNPQPPSVFGSSPWRHVSFGFRQVVSILPHVVYTSLCVGGGRWGGGAGLRGQPLVSEPWAEPLVFRINGAGPVVCAQYSKTSFEW